MRVLVTGSSGFVGSHMVRGLVSHHTVWPVSRHSGGFEREIVQDLSDDLDLTQFPDVLDTIVHCGGIVGNTSLTKEQYQEINTEGTKRLLEYGATIGIEHFIFFSTGGIYATTTEPLAESARVAPKGHYAISKWKAEEACREYADRHFRVTIVRPFFPYGPEQKHRLIPGLANRIRQGQPVELRREGDGPKLNPVFIVDLVHCISLLLERTGDATSIFNIGGPDVVSVRALAEQIASRLGIKARFQRHQRSESNNWIGVSDQLEAKTGYQPTTTLHQGLAQTIARVY